MRKRDNTILYLPCRLMLIFLIITEALFWIGPIRYDIPNTWTLFFYFVILNLAYYYGYKRGVDRFKPSIHKISDSWIKFIIFIGIFASIWNLYVQWSYHGLSININSFINAIYNPGEAYYSDSYDEKKTSLISILLSPFDFASIPLGIYYWKRFNKTMKFVVILNILINVFLWLGIGTRKGIFDLILIISIVFIIRRTDIITNKALRKKFIIGVSASILLFLFYFVFSNLSRGGNQLVDILTIYSTGDIRDPYNSLPVWLTYSLIQICSYLTQGYYALSLALNNDILLWAPMGMSWFTIIIARKFGYDPTPLTHMYNLENYDISMSVNWHSIYTWLANDFTFIGVPIVIYIIGRMFSLSWCDSISGRNPYSVIVSTLYFIMVFYFFANNQVLSFSFVPFVVFNIIYIITRKK